METLVCRINQPCIRTVCRTVERGVIRAHYDAIVIGDVCIAWITGGWVRFFGVRFFLLFFMRCANVWFINGCGGWSVFDECQKWNSWMPWNMGADVLLSFSSAYSITARYVKDWVVQFQYGYLFLFCVVSVDYYYISTSN